MKKKFVTALIVGLFISGKIEIADANLIYNFEDGTTQGWSATIPFGGELGIDTSFGNPGFSMYATDTVAGGGGLRVKAPSFISGDLTQFTSITWDEYVPYRGSATKYSTSVFIEGSDGSFYISDYSLISTNNWNTKFASFTNPYDWTLYYGPGILTFNEVVTSAAALYFAMDTSTYATGVESWIDNVNFSSSPVPVPGTIFLLGTGIAGLVGTRLRSKKK